MSSINNPHEEKSEDDKEIERLVQEFLSRGGQITKCAPNARTEEVKYMNNWGGKKPKSKEE